MAALRALGIVSRQWLRLSLGTGALRSERGKGYFTLISTKPHSYWAPTQLPLPTHSSFPIWYTPFACRTSLTPAKTKFSQHQTCTVLILEEDTSRDKHQTKTTQMQCSTEHDLAKPEEPEKWRRTEEDRLGRVLRAMHAALNNLLHGEAGSLSSVETGTSSTGLPTHTTTFFSVQDFSSPSLCKLSDHLLQDEITTIAYHRSCQAP